MELPGPQQCEVYEYHDLSLTTQWGQALHRLLLTCRERVNTVDMRQSHLWYPVARALERRIVYHAGPTNSGKTYEALQVS